MTKETKAILTNRALIDIQQDPRCNRPYLFKFAGNDDFPIIVRALANGDIAVGFFNLSDAPANLWVAADDLGNSLLAGKDARRDGSLYGLRKMRRQRTLSVDIEGHTCEVYRMKVKNTD